MSSPAKSKGAAAKGSSEEGGKAKKVAKRDPDQSDYEKFTTASSILPSSHSRGSFVKESKKKQVALLSAARRLVTDEGYIQIRELTGSGPLSDVAKHELAVGIACCVVALSNKAAVLPVMTDVQRVDAIHVHQAGAFLGLPTHNEKLYGGERVAGLNGGHIGEAHDDERQIVDKVAHEVYEEAQEKERKTDEQHARRAEKERKADEQYARRAEKQRKEEADRKRSRKLEEEEGSDAEEEEKKEQPKPKRQKKSKNEAEKEEKKTGSSSKKKSGSSSKDSSAASSAPSKQPIRTTRSQARSVSRER